MRKMFVRNPAIVTVATNNDTNNNPYGLHSLMAVDAFGLSQFVHHSLL